MIITHTVNGKIVTRPPSGCTNSLFSLTWRCGTYRYKQKHLHRLVIVLVSSVHFTLQVQGWELNRNFTLLLCWIHDRAISTRQCMYLSFLNSVTSSRARWGPIQDLWGAQEWTWPSEKYHVSRSPMSITTEEKGSLKDSYRMFVPIDQSKMRI